MSQILEIKDLSFGYKGLELFKKFSAQLRLGTTTLLVGPNGSGKTTLLKMIAGILQPADGEICIGGDFLLRQSSEDRAKKVVYLGSDLQTQFALNAEQVVQMGNPKGDRIQWAMELTGCWEYRSRDVRSLSGGETQLVALARALAQVASGLKMVLLDESLSKIDIQHRSRIRNLLKDLCGQGWTFLIVSHDLNFGFEISDRCILIGTSSSGLRKAFEGKLEDVVTQENLETVFPGIQCHLFSGVHKKDKPVLKGPPFFLATQDTRGQF